MWKNRLLYVLLVVYSCLFIVLYEEYTSFLVSAIVVLLPFGMACIIGLLVKSKIEVSFQENIGYLYQGESAKIILNIENKSILPVLYATVYIQLFYGHGKKRETKKIKVYADAKDKQEVELTIKPEYCGLVNIKVSKIKIYDYFRIYVMSKKKLGEIQLPVWPERVELEENEKGLLFQKIEMGDTFSKDRAGDDPSEIFDIRTYREGDRLQRIHWKLSSKKEQILVKEFSLPLVEQMVILVSVEQAAYECVDAVIQKLVTVIEYLLEQEKEVLVYWYTKEGLSQEEISKKEQIVFLLQQIYEGGLEEREEKEKAFLECLQEAGVENGYFVNQNGVKNLLDAVK